MHGEATLTPAVVLVAWLLRIGVPLVCAVIAVDAARRPEEAFGRVPRKAWIGIALAILLALVAAFIWPGVAALRVLALLALPLTFALGVAYLFSVVFPPPKSGDGPVDTRD